MTRPKLSSPMKTLMTAAGLALLASACNMDCVIGSGTPEQRTLSLARFDRIEVEGAVEVTVEKGTEQRVTITGEPNILALVDTTVGSGLWHVGTSGCYTSSAGIQVHITTPALASIALEGSGSVRSADVFGTGPVKLSSTGSGDIAVDGLNVQDLSVEVTGSGSITVKGTCAKLDGTVEGSGDLLAKELVANEASLSVTGSGNATITAISKLKADVQGSGEVHYAGKPEVKTSVEGSGSVTPL